jgi:hypothetical protein
VIRLRATLSLEYTVAVELQRLLFGFNAHGNWLLCNGLHQSSLVICCNIFVSNDTTCRQPNDAALSSAKLLMLFVWVAACTAKRLFNSIHESTCHVAALAAPIGDANAIDELLLAQRDERTTVLDLPRSGDGCGRRKGPTSAAFQLILNWAYGLRCSPVHGHKHFATCRTQRAQVLEATPCVRRRHV